MKRFFFYYYFGELSRIKLNYVSKIITIMQINVRNVWYAWARKKKLILIIVDKIKTIWLTFFLLLPLQMKKNYRILALDDVGTVQQVLIKSLW